MGFFFKIFKLCVFYYRNTALQSDIHTTVSFSISIKHFFMRKTFKPENINQTHDVSKDIHPNIFTRFWWQKENFWCDEKNHVTIWFHLVTIIFNKRNLNLSSMTIFEFFTSFVLGNRLHDITINLMIYKRRIMACEIHV